MIFQFLTSAHIQGRWLGIKDSTRRATHEDKGPCGGESQFIIPTMLAVSPNIEPAYKSFT